MLSHYTNSILLSFPSRAAMESPPVHHQFLPEDGEQQTPPPKVKPYPRPPPPPPGSPGARGTARAGWRRLVGGGTGARSVQDAAGWASLADRDGARARVPYLKAVLTTYRRQRQTSALLGGRRDTTAGNAYSPARHPRAASRKRIEAPAPRRACGGLIACSARAMGREGRKTHYRGARRGVGRPAE